MFKFRPYFLLLLILAVFSLNSCSDDDEDPIPLPTLEGKWVLDFLELRNLPPQFSNYQGEFNAALLSLMSLEYNFEVDENDQTFVEYADAFNGLTFATEGTWEFNDDETELSLFFDNGNDAIYDVLDFSIDQLRIQITEVFSLPDPNSEDPENPTFVDVNATVIYHYYKVY